MQQNRAILNKGLSWLAPQAIDRLGIVTLLSSFYFFQIWGLTVGASSLPGGFHAVMMAVSLVGILLPRLWHVLGLNSAIFVVFFLLQSPVASNNLTTAFFFSSTFLAVYLSNVLSGRDTTADRDSLFVSVAGPARWILAGLYFYGIYHKINTDFLDPVVSCAVVLYKTLTVHVALQDLRVGHYVAIYITFIIEGIAMVALFIPRLKRFGMLIGLPFHIVIGFSGYAYYKDFSTIVLVLYALFLPKAAVDMGVATICRFIGGDRIGLIVGRLALVAFVLTYLIVNGTSDGIGIGLPTHENFVWFFAVYCFAYYAFVVISIGKMASDDTRYRLNWMYIFPVLFFLNGMSPYLGLKTDGAIAMYSNLHTEGGQTNHLIHGRLPGTFLYQEDPVTPLASNNPNFDQRFVQPDTALVRFEFDRILANNPDLIVSVATSEGTRSTAEDWENTYANSNWLARKFLIFKQVDFARPKVCTH